MEGSGCLSKQAYKPITHKVSLATPCLTYFLSPPDAPTLPLIRSCAPPETPNVGSRVPMDQRVALKLLKAQRPPRPLKGYKTWSPPENGPIPPCSIFWYPFGGSGLKLEPWSLHERLQQTLKDYSPSHKDPHKGTPNVWKRPKCSPSGQGIQQPSRAVRTRRECTHPALTYH